MKNFLFVALLLLLVGCTPTDSKSKLGEWSSKQRELAIERYIVEHESMVEFIINGYEAKGHSRQQALQKIDKSLENQWSSYIKCQKNNCHDLLWARVNLTYLSIEHRFRSDE